MRPPPIAGASLPKRALSASATWPAGTIGIVEIGAAEFGIIMGACDDGASAPPEPNASPRLPCPGEISPVEGVAENNELDCAAAMCGMASARMSASIDASAGPRAGDSRAEAAAIAGVRLMMVAFSAQIAAISSRDAPATDESARPVGSARGHGQALVQRRLGRAFAKPVELNGGPCRFRRQFHESGVVQL